MLLSQLRYLAALAKEPHPARTAKACPFSRTALPPVTREPASGLRVAVAQHAQRSAGLVPETGRSVRRTRQTPAGHDTPVGPEADDAVGPVIADRTPGPALAGAFPDTVHGIGAGNGPDRYHPGGRTPRVPPLSTV